MSTTLKVVDPTTIAELSGRFEPIRTEIEAKDLPVEGELPRDISGAYFRNGPNPRFTPLGSYTYPLEGDAMIHGLWIEGGSARYANRWVRTQGMAAEERAGHAIYGGLMTPDFFDMSILGPDPDPGWPFRLDPFINVIRHGGRYLALPEGLPPYEITPELETVGRYDFGGVMPGVCAHPKIDPVTGEMVLFRYDVEEPYLTWSVVAADGSVARPPTPIEVDRCFMIHDAAITEHFLVLLIGPAVLDVNAMLTGGSVLQWQPELGTQVALIDRTGTAPTRWIRTDTFWLWHFANAYETGDQADRQIVVDFPQWSSLGFGVSPTAPMRGCFARVTISLERGTFDLSRVEERMTEFPRIDDRLTGQRHRYITAVGNGGRRDLVPGEHDELVQYDMQSGTSRAFDCEGVVGEVVFAPRDGATGELDGYYMAFVTALDEARSAYFTVWDAAEFPAPPVAKVPIPQRVPNGLHGNWFPAV